MNERVEFMPINNKTTKKQLTEYAMKLEKALRAYRIGYYTEGKRLFVVRSYSGVGTMSGLSDYAWAFQTTSTSLTGSRGPTRFYTADTPEEAITLYGSNRADNQPIVVVGITNVVGVYKEKKQPTQWVRR